MRLRSPFAMPGEIACRSAQLSKDLDQGRRTQMSGACAGHFCCCGFCYVPGAAPPGWLGLCILEEGLLSGLTPGPEFAVGPSVNRRQCPAQLLGYREIVAASAGISAIISSVGGR